MHEFTNNARAVLSTALSAESSDPNYSVFSVVLDGSETSFYQTQYSSQRGQFQSATITDSSKPGQYEILHIVSREDAVFTVVRAPYGGVVPGAWPAGSVIEARVTAEMLGSFAQYDDNNVIRTNRGNSNPHGLCVDGNTSTWQAVQLAGWPVLQQLRVSRESLGGQDPGLTWEAVGGSHPVELGVPETWASDREYSRNEIVVPTVPLGQHYFFSAHDKTLYTVSSTDEPDFSVYDSPVEVLDSEGVPEGAWVPYPASREFGLKIDVSEGLLILSEVGFICTTHTGGASPSVSIGTREEPTRFVNNQALSQITGVNCVHRFPISAGGAAITEPYFTLVAPTTGKFTGRFYWRGLLFQPTET